MTSGVIVSLIAQKFKLDYFGQLLTCLISSSVPMAIIQASSSKNDLVVSLFVCCFFYYFLKALEENITPDFIFAGLSLGLALLTKGNALFFCLPIGLLISLKSIFQNRLTKTEFRFLLNTFGILLIAITVNFGHFYRNWNLYNTPFKGEKRLINEQINLPILFANAVRNYAIHIGTKFEVTKKFTEETISDLLGDELNNPASTLEAQSFSVSLSFQEEYAGNPLHIILLTFSFVFLISLVFKKDEQKSNLITLSLSILLSFVFICAVLKWNPWLSRIHNPLFFLGSPLIAFFLVKKLENILTIIISVFLISTFFTFYLATPRSLIPFDTECVYLTPRSELYFSNCRNYEDFFIKATAFLKEKHLKEIGLDLSPSVTNYRWNDLEYPFFQFLKDDFAESPLLRHVGVENSSKILKPEKPMPEWVISTTERNVIENVEYIEVFKEKSAFAASPIRILQRKGIPEN
ncbi:MAG: glycosyltransferase family 39 protein [Pyrinomonadaceae bacterium]|nr:glycosyltransferase family 39 protein [Pyrinomonadaceae bacterium]